MSESDFIGAALVALATAAMTGVGLTKSVAYLPHAQPNARSLHGQPVPRVAALMLWLGWLAAIAWLGLTGIFPVSSSENVYSVSERLFLVMTALGWLTVTAVSLRDDWRGVSARSRLLVQGLAALATAAGWWALAGDQITEIRPFMKILLAAGLVLSTMWMANLFNFMDGSDGLAVTMALFGFGAYGWAAHAAGLGWWWLPALLVAAALPLLAVNAPPARMFIGDVGAVPLGFLAAALGWLGWTEQAWGGWFPLLVFLPFILDATLTLLRRLLRGERIWEGHKSHYYQRLLQMGAGHRGTLALYALLMAGCAASAVFCALRSPSDGWLVLAGWALAHLGIFGVIDYHWAKYPKHP